MKYPKSFYQPNGKLNTQKTFNFRFGKFSTKDATWNKELKIHNCCKSKKAQRHHIKCEYLKTITSDDLSDLK